jgi:hypothetical protein
MLTRDFTCSRNLSQEFVAVVIARENLTPLFSTDVNKLWKAGPFIFVFQASGVMPVSGASCFPLAPRLRPAGIAGPSHRRYQTARDCRRLDRMEQAKSVRRDSPWCTSLAQFFHKRSCCVTTSTNDRLQGNFHGIFAAPTELCTGSIEITLRINPLLLRFFIGSVEFVDA